ncbi:MAG: hypothetical protein ACJAT9_000146 [Polaribacter sp.]|jgi:hypothetical protein
MVVKEYKLKLDTKDAQKNVKGLNESFKEGDKGVKNYSGGLGALDKVTGGMASKFTGMTKSLSGATKGLNLMKVAIIGTGIGALLIGILAVSKAFTSSEEGQNKFNKILGIIGATVSVFTDKLADLGSFIIGVFENPKQALLDFKDAFVKNITNRISSAIETIGFLGSAIKKVFSGDFSGAMDDAKSAGSSYVDTLTGVKDTIGKVKESVKELTTEIITEGKAAGVIADQRAKADKLDRNLLVERAKANRKRAELLDKIAQREKFTAKERIEFLKEAALVEEEITNKEIAAASLRLSAKQAENALGLSTKEDLQEEAQLKSNLINLETAKLRKAKLVSTQMITVSKEEAAAKKAIDDAAKLATDESDKAEAEKKKELKTLQEEIRNAEAVTADEKRALEIEKVTEHYDKLIEEAKRLGLATEGLARGKANALKKFDKEVAENEISWSEMTAEQKGKIAKDGFNNLATILGEETAAGKAAAIASATISTFQSAQSSYNSLAGIPIIGPALGFAAAGAAVVSGFKQVKAITATKVPSIGGKAAPSSGGGSPSAPAGGSSSPPKFNIVGSSGTNQLADAIGSQEKKPVKAFVVAGDVSTAQEMDRNVISDASIG